MRRPLVTVAIVAVLLAATGCATERAGTGPIADGPVVTASAPTSGATPTAAESPGAPGASAGTPGATGVPATPTAQAGGNAKEVCAAAVQHSVTSGQTFFAELSKMLQATSTGDTTGAAAAKRKAQTALDSWAAGLTDQANRATDPQLKAVLAEISAEVASMEVDVNSVDEAELDRLRERLDILCGR